MTPTERPYYLHDIVADNLRWAADRPALHCNDRSFSWADFDARMKGLARGLSALGIGRGSRVSVLDRSTERCVFLHYALASLGAVFCPVNMWLRAGEIAYILERTGPDLLVTSAEFRPLAAEALALLEKQPRIVTHGAPREGDMGWEAIEDGPDGERPAPLSWDDPHMILFTSGTTGKPKGAIISHKRSVLDGMTASAAFGIRRGEVLFNYLPLFHTGAWDYLKLVFMHQGSAVIVDHFEADAAVRLVSAHRCNIMFGVPVVLRKMLESPLWPSSDMSGLRVLAYGNYDPGDFLDTVLDAFRARGAAHVQALFPYGLTEAGPFVTIARPDDTAAHPNTIGTPLAGVSVALLDDGGREVAPGEIGEICVRSPALMSGYLDMPEATAEAFAGGWLHTGDLGRMDESGFLTIAGRKKDMVRTGGENVFATEVEQLLITHPDIADVAVIGLPDPDYGEMVVAAVVARPGRAPAADEIIAFARARIAGFKTPKRIVMMDEFPRTVSGKVAKSELRQALAAADG